MIVKARETSSLKNLKGVEGVRGQDIRSNLRGKSSQGERRSLPTIDMVVSILGSVY